MAPVFDHKLRNASNDYNFKADIKDIYIYTGRHSEA